MNFISTSENYTTNTRGPKTLEIRQYGRSEHVSSGVYHRIKARPALPAPYMWPPTTL